MLEFVFLFANPSGTQQLELTTEVQTIRAKLRTEQRKAFLKLHLVRDASASAIEDALRISPHLIHFAGHGQSGALGVGNERNELHWMPKAALGQWLTVLSKRTRVVVLNACYSAEQAAPFLAAAECVVGMRGPITDAAALGFSGSFYSALGDGKSVAEAFESGRAGLLAAGAKEQDIPILLTRDGANAADIRLFHSARTVVVNAESSTDRELANELRTCLVPLSRLGVLEYSSVDEVPASETKTQYVEAALQQADVLLPLLSRDLINDTDLLELVSETRRRRPELRVVPIMLRAADLSVTPFAGLQVLPRSGRIDGKRSDRDLAWENITMELKALLARLLVEWNEHEHKRIMQSSTAGGNSQAPKPTHQAQNTQLAQSPAPSPPIPARLPPTEIPLGKRPTRPSLRALLTQLCRTASELEALCVDYFPTVAKEFSGSMSVTERVNLLLQSLKQDEILGQLRKVPGIETHMYLLAWE